MLSAVGFDLWETLITDTPEASHAQETMRLERMSAVLRAHGVEQSDEQVRRAYRELWNTCLANYWSADRDIPTSQQIAHFVEGLAGEMSTFSDSLLEELEEAYAAPTAEVLPRLLPDAVVTVNALRRQNYRIGLVSNTGRTPGRILRVVLEKHGLSHAFDAMVFSDEHGECKPKRSIFAKFSDELRVNPAEIVFVGDNIYCDVYGAQQHGMRAVHFNPPSRGLAVADAVNHGQKIVPDGTIRGLAELPPLLAAWNA